MIVEMVGPPGSGKTTIAGELDQHAQGTSLPILSFEDYDKLDREKGEIAIMKMGRLARWRKLMPMILSWPRWVVYLPILVLLHGRPFLRRSRKAQRVLAHVLFAERLGQRCPDRICVHHDGLTQCLWSMLIDSRKLRGKNLIRSLMLEYYRRIETKIVLLELEDSVAAGRVFERESKGRFNRDSAPKQRTDFPRWLDYHRQLVHLLPIAPGEARVDARASSQEVSKGVLDAIGDEARRT